MVDVIRESRRALRDLECGNVDLTVTALREARRIFCFGNGGGYAHAMHFASDLRKIAGKQAFSFDNLAELSARMNDQGWEDAWEDWRASHGYDLVTDLSFIFSVGGQMDSLSGNLPYAPYGIVGAKGRAGKRIVIPSTSTPVIEGCQSVIAHHLVEQLCE